MKLEMYDDQYLQSLADRHAGSLGDRARSELSRRRRLRDDPDTPSLFTEENINRVAEYNEPILRRFC